MRRYKRGLDRGRHQARRAFFRAEVFFIAVAFFFCDFTFFFIAMPLP